MSKIRAGRVGEQIKKELSQLIQSELNRICNRHGCRGDQRSVAGQSIPQRVWG
jgi:hypothetical protein